MTTAEQGIPPCVLVAMDKFKGSLSAAQAVDAVAAGVLSAAPHADVVRLPIADGGDGTVECAISAGFGRRALSVVGADDRLHEASIALRDGVAVIDVAGTAGLQLVDPARRDALSAHSFGVGQAIRVALDLGAREIVLGLGGSASTDGGTGMLRALGVRFLDSNGDDIALGGRGLQSLARIDTTDLDPRLLSTTTSLAIDVDSPLLGPTGAARMFGPQKGANEAEVALLEAAMTRYADVVGASIGRRLEPEPGAGTAGGIGFAGLAFLRASIRSGAEHCLELVRFPAHLPGSTLVVTGEGRLDHQSLHGKAPVAVARAASSAGVPVIAVVGSSALRPDEAAGAGFATVYPLSALEPDRAASQRMAATLLVDVGRRLVADGWV